MKNYIFVSFLLFTVFLSSCNSNKNNEVDLFNNYFFELAKKEKQIEITASTKRNYFEYIKEKNIQIPLFKYIKNQNYDIYIGIPVSTSIKDRIESDSINNILPLEQKTDSILFNFNRYKIVDNYVAEYTTKIQGNLLYILAITKSKSISDSLFNYNKLSNRIIKKK